MMRKRIADFVLALALLLAIVGSMLLAAGCCSLSPLERTALTVHQDQHPGIFDHPMPWEKGSLDT